MMRPYQRFSAWRRSIPLFLAVCSAVAAWGASTQVWEISAYNDFLAGKFENLSLDRDGRLKLGPALESVFASEQPLIWAVAVAEDGTIYAGTGHEGRVYRVTPDGKSDVFWKAPEIEVFALALGPAGVLYAATSPNGKVYRLSADGKAEIFFDPKQTYIWSLALAPARGSPGRSQNGAAALFAGTGDQGKIYKVEAPNQGEVYFETQQRHVVSLAFDREGRLLAGTDPNGVLYRIEGPGKAFALHDADLPEVRSLQVAGGGDLYAAAVGGGVPQTAEGVQTMAVSSAAGATQTISVTTNVGDGPEIGIGQGQPKSQTGGPTPVVTISQPVISYGTEKAAVLRVRPDLAVEKLWSSRDENLVALSVVDAATPQVLLATDKFGRIYRLDGRDISLVAQTDQEQVTQLVQTEKGLLVATAHAGKLFRLGAKAASAGGYETAVRDTGKVSRWGRVHWLAEVPEETSVEFFTRSGNSARPDGSWSEWSPALRVAPGAREGDAPVTSPSARFIQWKAQFRGSGTKTPVLERVRLTFLPQNSAPVVNAIDISASAADDSGSAAATPAATGAAESTASFSITVSGSAEGSTPAATSTPQQTIQADKQRRLTVTWHAEDPDGDKLVSALSFRGEGESAWKLVKKDLSEASLAIDSDTLADGIYWFRVVVSDSPANPPESAQSAERTSQPVLIDHTPPVVRLLAANGRASAQFEAVDEASMLQSAEYSIDAGSWVPVLADDGIVDSRREMFTVRLPDLAPGEHLVTLRVRDRAGNAGLAKAVIR